MPLLAKRAAAREDLGIICYDDMGLIVRENTDEVHNLIVCTLCPWLPDASAHIASSLVQAAAVPLAGG